jgi:hypothetical protein
MGAGATMRLMSFSMTTEAVRRHEKTVTRRLGWLGLQPGALLLAVEKAQGLKKGEHVTPICVIRVVSVKQERLDDIIDRYDYRETTREGFPDLSSYGFVGMFCAANHCGTDAWVNRIEFEYVP